MTRYSQAGQDLFVLKMLGNKRNGTYLDIGSYVSRHGSNTFLLDQEFDWDGICVDLFDFNSLEGRKRGTFILHDATKPYPEAMFEARARLGEPIESGYKFDYLSLDVDEATNAALALALAFARYRVITIEHDVYARGKEQQQYQRDLILGAGYQLTVPDVALPSMPSIIFEDWYTE